MTCGTYSMAEGCWMGGAGTSVGESSSGSSSSSIVLCKANWANAEDVDSAWLGCLDQKSKNPRHLVQNSDKIRTVGVALFVLATRGPKPVIVLDWGNVGAPCGSRGCIGAGSSDFRSRVEWIWSPGAPVLYPNKNVLTRIGRVLTRIGRRLKEGLIVC